MNFNSARFLCLFCIISVNFLFFVFVLYLYLNLFLSGGPTSFSFYAIVVVSLNKIFQFNSIQFKFQYTTQIEKLVMLIDQLLKIS